jgi:hypothetical protein
MKGLRRIDLRRVGRRRPISGPPERIRLEDTKKPILFFLEKLPLTVWLFIGIRFRVAANVRQLVDGSELDVDLVEVIARDEVNRRAVIVDLYVRESVNQRDEDSFSVFTNVEEIQLPSICVGCPLTIFGVHCLEPPFELERLIIGDPLRVSAAASDAIQTLGLLAGSPPDEVQGPTVG